MCEWLLDHPHVSVNSYKELLILVNSNKTARKWYNACRDKYSIICNAPQWVLTDEELYKEWRKEFYDYHVQIKQIERDSVKEIDKLRTEFQSKVKSVNDRNDQLKLNIFRMKPMLAVDYITVQSLPLDITAETLSMSDDERKARLVVLLADYKNRLYKDFRDGVIDEAAIHKLLLTD